MQAPQPRILYGRILEGGDNLDELSRDDLMRRIRQLNLLVMSAGNRAATLAENLETVETLKKEEADLLRSERNALQFVELENVQLKAAITAMKKDVAGTHGGEAAHLKICELTNSVVVLEGVVKSKQDYIDCCEAEIVGLKALIRLRKEPIRTHSGESLGFMG